MQNDTQRSWRPWYRFSQLSIFIALAVGYHAGGLSGMAAVGLGVAATINVQRKGMA